MQNYKQIKNGVKFTENGWIRINTKGSPYEIGYTHGYLLTDELK